MSYRVQADDLMDLSPSTLALASAVYFAEIGRISRCIVPA